MLRMTLLTFASLCMTLGSLTAQVASEVCLTEVRAAFRQIDAQHLMQKGTATQVTYQHTYTMRADRDRKEVSALEERTYAPNFFRHNSPDALEISDDKEAFNVRKYQYIIYQTAPTLQKSSLIPLANPGLFQHCKVRECHFVPAPNNDTLSHKRAYMTVNDAGQKKYQIKSLEFITNPLDTTLISVAVDFTDRSLYTKAKYEFKAVGDGENAPEVPVNAAAAILNSEGSLSDAYKGFSLKDYR